MATLRGRPRDNALDGAITDATESLLLSDGYAAVNIDRIQAALHRCRLSFPKDYLLQVIRKYYGHNDSSAT